jgi:hypothetical protein
MMGSQSEESLRKKVNVLKNEMVHQREDIEHIKKLSGAMEKERKKDKGEILDVLEKEAKYREYWTDQPVVNGLIIQPEVLMKMQEDQKELKEQVEYLEQSNIKMESSHIEALEATRQEGTRHLKNTKQELQEDQKKLEKQLTKAEQELESAAKAKVESQEQLKKTKQEIEAATQANVREAGKIEAIKSQLKNEKAIVQELKNENRHLNDVHCALGVKEEKMKTMLNKSYAENLKLKKKIEEATDAAQLDCEHKDCGARVQCKEYAAHQATCEYRKVLCPRASAICGEMVAFRDIKQHVQDCPGIYNISTSGRNQHVWKEFLSDEQLGQMSPGTLKFLSTTLNISS